METRQYLAEPLLIHISHDCFRRLLNQAAETDRQYPWLHQHQYFIDHATIDDRIVRLKLG